MMKFILLVFITVLSLQKFNAQAIVFTAKKFIEYHPEYAEWDKWPDEWVSVGRDQDFKMTITPVV